MPVSRSNPGLLAWLAFFALLVLGTLLVAFLVFALSLWASANTKLPLTFILIDLL